MRNTADVINIAGGNPNCLQSISDGDAVNPLVKKFFSLLVLVKINMTHKKDNNW
jgi:hypothetical protein